MNLIPSFPGFPMHFSSRTWLFSACATLALIGCKGDDSDITDTDTDVVIDTETGDTTAPTVAITDSVSGAVADGDVTFTFTFSEDVGDSFTASDVTLGGGTAGAFAMTSGTVATLVVTPTPDATGTITVGVAAAAFEDLAGNPNTASASGTQGYDTTVETVDTVLIDFEAATPPKLTGFGGAEEASVVVDPTDGTNKVGKIVKSGSAQPWAGVTLSYCAKDGTAALPFTATETSVSVRVWSPDANTTIRVKVEDVKDDTISVETEAKTTAAGAWETLTFDFSKEASGTAKLNVANTYSKLSVFPNFGTGGGAAGAKTYYVDDVTFLDNVFPNDCPDDGGGGGDYPISFDDSKTTYTLTGFGGAEDSTLVADPTDATNKVAKVIKSGTAETWAGTTISTGPSFSVPTLPFTATDAKMTLRVWSTKAGLTVRLKVEDAADPTRSVETDAKTTTASAWNTLTFDFTKEASGTAKLNPAWTYNKASVFFDYGKSGVDGGGGTYYCDDLDLP